MSTNINITVDTSNLVAAVKIAQETARQAQEQKEAEKKLEEETAREHAKTEAAQGRDANGNPITGAFFTANGNPITGAFFTPTQIDRRAASRRSPSGKAEMAIAFVAEAGWRDGENGANRWKWFICSGDCSAVIDLADVLNLDLVTYGDTQAFWQPDASVGQPSFCHVYPFASSNGEQCMMVHIGMNQRLLRGQNYLSDAQVLLSIGPNWIKTVPLAGKTLPPGPPTGGYRAQTTFIGGNYGFIADKRYRYSYGAATEESPNAANPLGRWSPDDPSFAIYASGSPLSWNTAEIPGTNATIGMASHLTVRAWMQANLQEWRVMAPKFRWFVPPKRVSFGIGETELSDYWYRNFDEDEALDIFSYEIIQDPFTLANDVSISQYGPEVTTDETKIKIKTISLSPSRFSTIRSLPNMNWSSSRIEPSTIILSSTYGADKWCRDRLLRAGFSSADLAPDEPQSPAP